MSDDSTSTQLSSDPSSDQAQISNDPTSTQLSSDPSSDQAQISYNPTSTQFRSQLRSNCSASSPPSPSPLPSPRTREVLSSGPTRALRMVGIWTLQEPPAHVKYVQMKLREPPGHVKQVQMSRSAPPPPSPPPARVRSFFSGPTRPHRFPESGAPRSPQTSCDRWSLPGTRSSRHSSLPDARSVLKGTHLVP